MLPSLPTHPKLTLLSSILDMSLSEISQSCNIGEIGRVFTVDEIVGLVEALFSASELREACVKGLRDVLSGGAGDVRGRGW